MQKDSELKMIKVTRTKLVKKQSTSRPPSWSHAREFAHEPPRWTHAGLCGTAAWSPPWGRRRGWAPPAAAECSTARWRCWAKDSKRPAHQHCTWHWRREHFENKTWLKGRWSHLKIGRENKWILFDFGNQQIFKIRVTHSRRHFQSIQTNSTTIINVRMINRCQKSHVWRFHGISAKTAKLAHSNLECSTGVIQCKV